MYTEIDGSRKAIGDVDVLWHEGLYHLFHLVLPNHDFIAHAVSTDGIHWRRVRNALFIGDPGSWDDLMLWTMHVSPDPHCEGAWRMFYTGLSRRDRGKFQRIGLATSDDLYKWEKQPVNWEDGRGPNDPDLVKEARRQSRRRAPDDTMATIDPASCFPLEPSPEFYEADLKGERHLVSFRDPYYSSCGDRSCLLVAARVKDGPMVRRGCVAMLEEVAPNRFENRPPLHHPGLYDDVEVPNLLSIDGHLYLIGSLREDAKIRYWHGDDARSEWCSYHENVLMPQGNYAGRVCRDEKGWLLWCFFAMNRQDRTADNLMPPAKRLVKDDSGLLYMKTYEEFESWREASIDTNSVRLLRPEKEGDVFLVEDSMWKIRSRHGYQGFLVDEELESFWLSCRLRLHGKGKCGILLRVDQESHNGYYLSLDLLKGVAQLRAWGTSPDQDGENMMSFETLQSAFWVSNSSGEEDVSLLVFGSYIEFSVGGRIVLSLADRQFDRGHMGVYLDTAEMSVSELKLDRMRSPDQVEDHLIGA